MPDTTTAIEGKLCKFSGGVGLSMNKKDKGKTEMLNLGLPSEDSFHAIKHLFPSSRCGDEHVVIQMSRLIAKFRARFKGGSPTAPRLAVCASDIEGWYVISDALVDMVQGEFDELNSALGVLKARSFEEYPVLLEKAREAHGDQFNITEYPHNAEALCRKVYARLDWMPFFNPDNMAGRFSVVVLDRMRAQAQEMANKVAANAGADVFRDLLNKLSHIAMILQNPDARIVESTIENLKEACDLAKLKILLPEGSDQRVAIEAMADEVKERLSSIDVGEIRRKGGLRETVGSQLSVVAAQFEQVGKRRFGM